MSESNTTTLRRTLEELGVEYRTFNDDFDETAHYTEWWTHDGAFGFWARESKRRYGDDLLRVETSSLVKACMICTPEQAIAATLGAGTCRMQQTTSRAIETSIWEWHCESCDQYCSVECVRGAEPEGPRFCPNCGAKVEELLT